MLKIIGIIFKGDKLYAGREKWNSEFYWLTEKQYREVYLSQDKSETKGRIFTVNNRLFRLSDILYAVPVDLDDRTVQYALTNHDKVLTNKYLFKELEREGVDVKPYIAEAEESFRKMYGDSGDEQ